MSLYPKKACLKNPSTCSVIKLSKPYYYVVKLKSTITLNSRWNLIGYSSNTSLDLANARFTNNSGSNFTWANAVANNKISPYFAYYDSSSALGSGRKYKYVATSDLSMDDTVLRNGKGYWVYANQSGNLTLPSIGGTLSGQNYPRSSIRISNGSLELSISEAGNSTYSWLISTLKYWNTGSGDFKSIDTLGLGGNKKNISSFEGVFVYSNINNLTLMRQN